MAEHANDSPDDRMAVPAMVALTRLTLTDFRNYAHLLLRVDPAPVVLTGDNGAGKTNLLEAVSLLAPGRGLRRARLSDCAREGGDGGWAVAAEVTGPVGSMRLGTGLAENPAGPGRQRQCRIDGIPVSGPGAFAEHLGVVWLTPAMDRLFSGPPGDRRRFLDRLVATIDRGHVRRVAAYERAMSGRNRLLSLGRAEPAWVEGLEAQMAEHGVAIAAARTEAVARLGELILAVPGDAPFPPAELALEGTLEGALATEAAVDVEDRFRAGLAASRPRDQAAGRTLDGPHTSDLATRHGVTGTDAGRSSTGEQKALLISIVLAQARLAAGAGEGVAPVLLLDEVAAHLDEARREGLFAAVTRLGAQAWMTGTDAALFAPMRAGATFLAVADGHVETA